MLNNSIEINHCKHYFANEICDSKLFFINYTFGVEIDTKAKHPLGVVYKAKGVIDTPVRWVVQPNNSILFFNIYEWINPKNSFIENHRELMFEYWWEEKKAKIIEKLSFKKIKKPTLKINKTLISYSTNW
jgi:hypothetical protein